MFLIDALLVVLHMGLTFGEYSTYSFTGNDVCYEPYNDVISDVDYIMSLTSCSFVCAKDECCSFMYDAVSQRCITSSEYARNFNRGGCEWKYMVNQNKCDTPGPYTPYAPNTCDHGYSFNHTDNQCFPSCETYGSTFGKFEKCFIEHLNQKTIRLGNTPSIEIECLEQCFAITEFVCRTVEIFPKKKLCQFSNETALSRPEEYKRIEGVTLFHRNCA